jgi:2-alkenal reductase
MKVSTIFLVLFILLAVGCSNADTTDVPAANDTAVMPNTGIVNTSAQSAPVAVPNTQSTDVVTEQTYIDIYNRLNPAVVNIQVVGGAAVGEQFFEIPEHEDVPEGFEDYFENLPEDFNQMPSQGQGSGFVYDQQGHIITNNHVVEGAEKITVIFANGAEVDATLIGADPGSDLAVIKVDVPAAELTPVVLADSDQVQVGQLVATIGNPFGLSGSMSTGIVSGLGRMLPGASSPGGSSFNIPDIIQTDAAINPGNSGGPLLNLDGQVIGVNTAIQTNGAFGATASFGGVGYAVPANIVRQVAPQLIENGEITYPWLGVAGGTLSRDAAVEMGLEANQQGVLVNEVIEGGPAAKAGLRGSNAQVTVDGIPLAIGGDVIVQMGDQPVAEFDDLLTYIVRQTAVGETVTVTIIRDGELMDVEVTLEARPSN